MQKAIVFKTTFGLLFFSMLLFFAQWYPGEAMQAFNQNNLIRAAEIHEVDGRVFYQRLAPVSDMLP
ncbi:MAG: hypothetical protein KGZ79_14915 [Dethiobacter sp.]|jgi:hypothetical protein|nr:hypothetical protein [Dethiobacter sp.]